MTKNFSVGECFSVGLARFKEHAWFLMGLMLFFWVIALLLGYLTEDYFHGIEPTRSSIDFFSNLILYWLCFGLTVIAFKILDAKPYSWQDLLIVDKQVLWYLIGSVLYGFIVVVGLALFIVPGIYLMIRYGFFWYAIVDGRKNVFDAFRESARITDGVKWNIMLFGFASIGLILLGVLLFGLGTLVTIPVVMLATAHLYRVLLRQSMVPLTETTPTTPNRPVEPAEVPVVAEPAPLVAVTPPSATKTESTNSN